MARSFTKVSFGPDDEVVVLPVPEGGAKGRISVFARLTGSGGAASLRVYGSFDSDPIAAAGAGNEIQTLDFGNIDAPAQAYTTVLLAAPHSITRNVTSYSTVVLPEAHEHINNVVGYTNAVLPNKREDITRNVIGYSDVILPTALGASAGQGLPPEQDDEFFSLTNTALGPEPGQPPPDDEDFSRTTYAFGFDPGQPFPGDESMTQTNYTVGDEPGQEPEVEQEFATQTTTTPSLDTFKLTFNGHETTAVTYSTDMSAAIQAALVALVDFVPGDVVVTKGLGNTVYAVTFGGAYANEDVSAITITSQVGFTATGVTETTKGGANSGTEDLTDSATLGNPIIEVVSGQEGIFPYLTLVFGGDADPGLAAEAYVVSF